MVHKHKLATLVLPLVLNILLPLLMITFRCTWIWLIKNQSGVFSVFQTFLNEIKADLAYPYMLYVVTILVNICLTNFSNSCNSMVSFIKL